MIQLSRRFRAILLCVALAAPVLLFNNGCSTPQTQKEPGVDLNRFQRFFVETTLNDNHAVDELIVAELRRRGFTAERGPLTMMPPDSQVVITYRDRWTWDFTSYMIELQISAREAKRGTALGTSRYYTPTAIAKSPVEMVGIVTRSLFGAEKRRPAATP